MKIIQLAEEAKVRFQEDYCTQRQQNAEEAFWAAIGDLIGEEALEELSERIVELHCDTNESIDQGLRWLTV